MLALSLGSISAVQAEPIAVEAKRSDAAQRQAEQRARKAQVEFDAIALQALIEPMMAGMKGGPLGSGQAGRYWQSLMTEHVARHIASSGRLQLLKAVPNTPAVARRPLAIEQGPRGGDAHAVKPEPPTYWQTDVRRAVDEWAPHAVDKSGMPPNRGLLE